MKYYYILFFFLLHTIGFTQVTNCLVASELTADPLPDSETLSYAPGTTVNFCFTILYWSDGSSNEWLHSIEIQFGEAWDLSSLIAMPPPSCSQTGYWDWYELWASANTGIVFGPGFAFDSNLNGPLDGDPGNNFGDGPNGCSIIGGQNGGLDFCWTIQVNHNLPPNETPDLSLQIDVLSDGRSGAWTTDACSAEIDYIFSPEGYYEETVLHYSSSFYTCDQVCTGQLILSTLDTTWHHRLLDEFGTVIFEDTLPAGIDTIPNLCSGYYTLESSTLSNSTIYEHDFSIGNRSTPTAIASYEDAVCFNESPQLFGDSEYNGIYSVYYQWLGPDGYSSNLRDPSDGPSAGTYILTANVGYCISDPDTIVVPAYPNPSLIITPGPTVTICPGEVVHLSASGGQVYKWYSGNDLIIVSPTLNIAPTTTTLYSVQGPVSGAICNGYGEVLVIVNDFSAQDLGPDQNLCTGESLTLGSTDASLQYQWSTGETVSPITVTPTVPTTYSLTVTAGQGCGAEFDVLITPISSPDVSIETNSTIHCPGFITTLTANYSGGTPPYTLEWSTGETTDNILVSPISPTTYSVTITDSNGCSAVASINIEVDDEQITIEASDTSICIGETAMLSVPGFFVNYNWSSGQTSPIIQVSSAGTYWVTVTNVNGCNFSDSINIEVFDLPAVPVINCSSTLSSVTFSWPTQPGLTYEASSTTGPDGVQVDNTYLISGLSPNEEVSMQLLVTNNGGCQEVGTQTCSAIDCPTITVDISDVPTLCQDVAPMLLEAMISGGNGSGTLNWQGTCISDPSSGSFDPQLCGQGTYQVLVTYTQGPCSYQASTEVTVLPKYLANFLVDNSGCVTDTFQVSYTGDAPASAPFVWDFAGANVLTGSGAGPYELLWTEAGDKQLSLFIDSDCPSSVVSQMISIEAPLPAPTITCAYDILANTLSFSWAEIPGAVSYDLTLNGQPIPSTTDTELIVDTFAPGELATLTVMAANSGPCLNEISTLSCAIPICADVAISADEDLICPGASTTLHADYGLNASYNWTPAAGLSCADCPNPLVSPASTTTYYLTVQNADGCASSDSITITIQSLPSIFEEPFVEICEGTTFELCLENVQMAVWTGPNNYYYENNCLIVPDFDATLAGIYSLNATLLNGCTVSDVLNLELVPPLSVLNISDPIEACPNQIFTLSAEIANADYYTWFPTANVFCQNCPTTLAAITHPTTFTLVALNEEGCELRIEIPATIPAGCQQEPDIDDPIFLNTPGQSGPVDLSIFPNPSRDQVTIQWNQEVEGILQVFNTKGQQIRQLPATDRQLTLDLQAWPSGVYWVRLVTKAGVVSGKVVRE